MELINLFLLPTVISEALCRIMKHAPSGTWDRLFYYGWNILLCLWSGHILTSVIRALLMRDIALNSVAYSLLMAVCYSIICFLANLILKNLSLKVEFENAKEP